jgi:hypothetical protein
MEFGDHRQRADELLADFEDILLQINGDFRSKEDNLHSPTPIGVQFENLPSDFSYVRSFNLSLTFIPTVGNGVLNTRDVHRSRKTAAAAMVFKKKMLQISLPRLYWTRNIGTRPSDAFSLRVFQL